jgi:PAS domain S-box-containing protein
MHDEWKQTFDALPDMLALIDTNHRIIRVNKAMAICLNMTPEKCVGQPCYRLMHGKDAIPDQCPHSMLLKDESSHVVEVSERHLNMELQITVSPLFDEKGALIGCVHVARDITDSRKIENILKKSERCLHSITNNMMDLVTVLDLKGNI